MDKQIVTIKEAAQLSGLSVYAIRKGIADGYISAFQINNNSGRYFLDYNELITAFKGRCKLKTKEIEPGIKRIPE